MVQEQETDLGLKVAALEREFKDLKRLLTLGLVGGGDVEATLQQHTALLGKLIGDQTLGNVLLGPFPGADSQMSLRGTRDYYISASTNTSVPEVYSPYPKDLLWASPFYMPAAPNVIDRIGISVEIAGEAGSVARLGVYDNGAGFEPANLLLDAGEVFIDSFGFKEISLKESFSRGLKWAVVVHNSTTINPQFLESNAYATSSAGPWIVLGLLPGISGAIRRYLGWKAVHLYGALPGTFPPIFFPGEPERSIPLIWFRFASGGWS